jgi:restriction endonuclease S subunit
MKLHKLSDVCNLSKGKTITRATASEGKIPVIGGGLGPSYSHNKANRTAPVITISASGANAGFVNFWEEPIWASDCSTVSEIPNSPALLKYVYFFLQSKQDFIYTNFRRGSAQPHVYTSDISELEIPLPTLEKQTEIIKKLEAAFGEISSLRENLQKRRMQVDLLLRGALSISFMQHVDRNTRDVELGDIADFEGGSQPAKSNFIYEEREGYVRFIQIRDFGSDKNLTYIPVSNKNRLCVETDVLIGRYGASVGKILTGLSGAYNVALMKVIPKQEIVDNNFLYFYLLSDLFQDNLAKVSDRSAQNGFSKEDIGAFLLKLPSMEEQRKLVTQLTKVRSDIKILDSNIKLAISNLTFLQSSILSKSFVQLGEMGR